ncbi:MAG: hypothetical protein NVS3B12_14340 [Acidimicrobiales bacterium]
MKLAPAPDRSGAHGAGGIPGRHEWFLAVSEALGGQGPDMAVQPIVDLARGAVVGYEALARFAGPISATPDVWFATAAKLGFGASLEAKALERGLALVSELPANCFLSVNLNPAYLVSDPVRTLFERQGSLTRLVLELTEHEAIADYNAVLGSIAELRDRGAKIAIDDAGSGYAGLQWLLTLAPDLVKLDRALVADVDRDPAKLALVKMFGALTGGMDAWLLAEGIERHGELDALVRLGVPLGQGFALGRPGVAWTGTDPTVAARIRGRHEASGGVTVAALVEEIPTVVARSGSDGVLACLQADRALDHVMVVDDFGRPLRLIGRNQHLRSAVDRIMTVKAGETAADVAARAIARASATRWDPIVCVDLLGRYAGIIRPERLVEALIQQGETR